MILGKLDLFPQQFPVADQQGLPQDLHLVTRIINVVFSFQLIPASFEKSSQSVADCGSSAVSYMERPRGVRADKFEQHSRSVQLYGAPISLLLRVNSMENLMPYIRSEKEIHEAGSGYLASCQNLRVFCQIVLDRRGQLARLKTRCICQHKRGIGGVIAKTRNPCYVRLPHLWLPHSAETLHFAYLLWLWPLGPGSV